MLPFPTALAVVFLVHGFVVASDRKRQTVEIRFCFPHLDIVAYGHFASLNSELLENI